MFESMRDHKKKEWKILGADIKRSGLCYRQNTVVSTFYITIIHSFVGDDLLILSIEINVIYIFPVIRCYVNKYTSIKQINFTFPN